MRVCPYCRAPLPREHTGDVCPHCRRELRGQVTVDDDKWDLNDSPADTAARVQGPASPRLTLDDRGDSSRNRAPGMGLPGGFQAPVASEVTNLDHPMFQFQSEQPAFEAPAIGPDQAPIERTMTYGGGPPFALVSGLSNILAQPSIATALATLCRVFRSRSQGLGDLVELAAIVAAADGQVDEPERDALTDVVSVMLGDLQPELAQHLVESSLARIRESGWKPLVHNVASALVACEAVEEGLTLAFAIAYASDGISAPERAVIESIASAAEVPAAEVARIRGAVRAAVDLS